MNNFKRERSDRRQHVAWRLGPLLLWIGVIFFWSSSSGSTANTSLFIRPLLEFLFPSASAETLTFYHAVIRKIAHFAEYFVLGALAFRAIRPRRTMLRSFVAFALVAAVASADEFNQSFNPARTAAVADVLIDCAGGGTAAFFIAPLASRFWLAARRPRESARR